MKRRDYDSERKILEIENSEGNADQAIFGPDVYLSYTPKGQETRP